MWPSGRLNLECPKPKCFNRQVVAECKICVKRHKCELCKILRQHNRTITYTKNRKYDVCAHREENCQYVGKEYYTTYTIKKRKCADCKELSSQCTTNGNSFLIINYYILINLLKCCAHRLLSVQPDFMSQKCEIEESIIKSTNEKHYLMMYYPKYYCKLNHIKHFWCSARKWARNNYNYSLDDLCRYVPRALTNVPNWII